MVTEKVNLKSSAWMRARELQKSNILEKLKFVTAVVTRAGTVVREEQLLNILPMFVTAAVLNKGTAAKEVQLLNILFMLVTAAVLNKGTVLSEEQILNIL